MKIAGTFQYFYCTDRLATLQNQDVPTRDVTNTRGHGNKTEPHLETFTENWCRCRAFFITAAVRQARQLAREGGQHYLLLTTRHPADRQPFVVGIMPFSETSFAGFLQRYPRRWTESTYLPYASDNQMKLVSFADAFSLQNWMASINRNHIPGGQGGRGHVPEELLRQVLDHFTTTKDQTDAFLANVRVLESELEHSDQTAWKSYTDRLGRRDQTCLDPPPAAPRCCRPAN